MPKESFQKILIIRFSSIGDIVLTTSVIRNLRKAYPKAEIHFLTKSHFSSLLAPNPYLDKIHGFTGDIKATISELKQIEFDLIVDLHKNLRSFRIRRGLGSRSISFDKKNWEKFWLVQNKKDKGNIGHIVNRYEEALHSLGIATDNEGLDFFLPEDSTKEAKRIFSDESFSDKSSVLAIVLGATFFTKRWPAKQFIKAINQLKRPVVLLGGNDSREEADLILQELEVPALDMVGKCSLLVSAALMKQCSAVLTHDTGLMHIAAAFKMKVFSLWGNTVPALGMTPFQTEHFILENKTVNCRPCSKLGHHSCPKGHFKCMNELRPEDVVKTIQANTP